MKMEKEISKNNNYHNCKNNDVNIFQIVKSFKKTLTLTLLL